MKKTLFAIAMLAVALVACDKEQEGGKDKLEATLTLAEGVEAAIGAVKALSLSIGIPQHLCEIGVKREDIPALAVAAFNDVCTGGNPRPTSVEDIAKLYETAYE